MRAAMFTASELINQIAVPPSGWPGVRGAKPEIRPQGIDCQKENPVLVSS